MQTPENFEFRGSAREWFGIWIVNLLLSIVTLGIYSAWAKVRTKKYFYQNTWVAGRNFDYHATGMQILIGRALVAAALLVYSMSVLLHPVFPLFILIAYALVIPVILLRGMRFNARNSSWSNVRFDFVGKVGKLYLLVFIYPILSLLTAYTTLPFLQRAVQRYGINNHRLGKTPFHFDSGIKPFYMAFLAAFAIGLAGLAVAFAVFLQPLLISGFDIEQMPVGAALNLVIGYFIALISFAFAGVMYQALIRNHIFASTTLGEKQHGFQSTVKASALLWIAVSNLVVVLLTLGFMLPWAQVRMHRYLAQNSALKPNGSLDDFKGEIISETNAIGDAFSDMEGVEYGLPV
ncbi:DUF898 family protein [Epibacterium sp. SM1969]|uniref:DUF898 family protein n=1 Tax=Tritonibacter aquimaris TaxID=2663379 RepID=A0A844AKH2_9RHOB|nr:YjgN family protein [Tritonibacter aquimaris]MQY41875.1 DUF898 family protein [Tritonibacter aquimaris]